MELHRHTARELRLGVGILVLGVVGAALPYLLWLEGRELFIGPWLWYVLGGVTIVIGVYQLYTSVRPFRLVLREDGVTVRVGTLDATVPWESVEAITIERLSYLRPPAAPHVVLWPAPGVDLGPKPGYRRDGRAGFPLVQLDQLTETEGAVIVALQRYAGVRFSMV